MDGHGNGQFSMLSKSGRLAGGLAVITLAVLAVSVPLTASRGGPASLPPAVAAASHSAIVGSKGAGIPLQVNHQGVVAVNGVPVNGQADFRFALVDPDNGNLWTNDGSNEEGSSDPPTNAVTLLVVNGIYSVRLGDATLTHMTEIPADVFDDDNVVLRIWFDDRQNGSAQLVPDHVLASAPYAYRARHATTADNTSDLPPGIIAMWSGAIADIPDGWVLCDGTNGSPDLRDRFVVGAGDEYSVGATGGEKKHTLTVSEMPSHQHSEGRPLGYGGSTDFKGGSSENPWGQAQTGATGGGQAHENRPPYYALTYIMRQ